jgi:hypothetical protein
MNDLAVSTTDENGKIVVGPEHFQRLKQILRDNPEGAAQRAGALRAMENQLRTLTNRMNKADPPAKESRPTYMDLTKKIADGTITDVNQIYEHVDKLTVSDLNRLRNEFRTVKTDAGQTLLQSRERFFKQWSAVIDPDPIYRTPEGLDRESRARVAAELKENELRKAGKNPQEAYNPASPDYFGKAENMLQYAQPPMQQRLRDQAIQQKNRPSVMPAEKVAPPAAPQSGSGLKQPVFDERFKGAFRPPGDWQFSPSRQQYRSPDGDIYDTDGKKLGKK